MEENLSWCTEKTCPTDVHNEFLIKITVDVFVVVITNTNSIREEQVVFQSKLKWVTDLIAE